MASRSDDAVASQQGTPAREKTSKSRRNSNKAATPPQTPGVSTPAPATASSSSSSIPTPPSSGRSTVHANRHHRRPSAALRAARAFLSSPPSPLSPPAAPSPPTSPPTTLRRLAWPSAAAGVSSAAMPSTPRIPREETPEVAQIPADQVFCACCDNGDLDVREGGKGKQQATNSQDQSAVQCAVHGDGQTIQTAQLAQSNRSHPPREREREAGSLTKVEAQREFLCPQI